MKRSPLLLAAALLVAPLAAGATSDELGGVVVAASSARPATLRSDPAKQVLAALAEYEKGYESQDLAHLRAVWEMGPVEQTLLEQSWRSCRTTAVTLRPGPVVADGPRARVVFDQELSLLCGSTPSVRTSQLEAVLRRDAKGRWVIASIAAQPGSSARGGSALAAGAGSADEREVLSILDRYADALSACDTPELSILWISNKTERRALQAACRRDGRPEVALSDARVSLFDGGSRATVDFVQTTAFGSRVPDRSSLRAILVNRGDGEWSIWKIKDIR
jgi:hypothetical protein